MNCTAFFFILSFYLSFRHLVLLIRRVILCFLEKTLCKTSPKLHKCLFTCMWLSWIGSGMGWPVPTALMWKGPSMSIHLYISIILNLLSANFVNSSRQIKPVFTSGNSQRKYALKVSLRWMAQLQNSHELYLKNPETPIWDANRVSF